jgi:FkbM family methyltransferase
MNNTDVAAFTLSVPGLSRLLSLWLHDLRDRHVSKAIAEQGVWEPFETQLLMQRLLEGSVFIDVGANVGYYSVLGGEKVGRTGRVFAFEPEPDNFLLLQKNLQHNDLAYVKAVNAALSNKTGSAALYLNENNFGDHQIYDNGEGRESLTIETLNGTEFLEASVSAVDVVKIDTQGAESQVVEGMMPLLRRSVSNLSMIIEFWPFGLRKSGSSAHQLLDMLCTLELPFFIIDHVGHDLLNCQEQQLREWVDMVENDPQDQGFMNILVGR